MTDLTAMPAVLTVDEAAGVLRIGRSCAYQAVRCGDIPSIKVGRSIRVPKFRLEQLLGVTTPETSQGRGTSPDLDEAADASGRRDYTQ